MEQRMKAVEDNIASIRKHLEQLKEHQLDSQVSKTETNKKLDMIVSTLTDNEYNGKNGWVTRQNNIEKMVMTMMGYWNVLFYVTGSGFILTLLYNLFVRK